MDKGKAAHGKDGEGEARRGEKEKKRRKAKERCDAHGRAHAIRRGMHQCPCTIKTSRKIV